MKSESLMKAIDLRSDIVNDREYRSNPNNRYHFEYQSSVNRIFATFIILMLIGAGISIFGIANTLFGILISLVCIAAVVMTGCVLIIFSVEFWRFLSGR